MAHIRGERESMQSNKIPLLESRTIDILEQNVDTNSPLATSISRTPPSSLSAHAWMQSILAQRDTLMWCIYWFFSNLVITFYNKHVLSSLNVSPLVNTFVHMSCTFIGCAIVQKGVFPKLTRDEFARIVMYAFIFALNIVWCQYAIKLTTLSLNQVCRAMTPLFQATFSYLIANQIHSFYTLLPLLPVCCGVAMTVRSELNLGRIALVIAMSSVVVSALKGVLSMKILQQDLKSKLQEYSFLVLVTPMAAAWTIVLELLFWFFYETQSDNQANTSALDNNNNDDELHPNQFWDVKLWLLLLLGGAMAFGVNVASIGTVKRTSATSMGVMANAKQAITIFGSMVFAEKDWVVLKLVGVVLTLFGASWYSYRKEMERKHKNGTPAQK